jgi:hypothetical protein
VLRRADQEDRVGTARLLQLEHLGADLVQRLVPADLLVLAIDQLHRRLEAIVAVTVLAQGGALGAVGAEIDRRVEHRLLACPDAVLDHRVDGAADRAMAADGAADDRLGVAAGRRVGGLGLLTRLSCEVARPTPTPRPERRRKARRSMVGMARPTPRSRLEIQDETGALPRREDLRVSNIVVSVDGPVRPSWFRSSAGRAA